MGSKNKSVSKSKFSFYVPTDFYSVVVVYSGHNYDCVASSTSMVIFANDTVVVGMISSNDERTYLGEIKHLETRLVSGQQPPP